MFGLPLHPLVVHAVIVLVPAAVIGSVLVAVWPRVRARWAWPVVALTAMATLAIPVATSTGEGLERNIPRTPSIQAHVELGDQLLVFVAAMLVCVAALVALDRMRRRRTADATLAAHRAGPGTMAAPRIRDGQAQVAALVLAVLTVGFALVSAVQVVRIGDSGARAAWGSLQYAPQPWPVGRDG
ncbi:MAG: hypothetical protein J0I34_13420 [Pseudonocardia sp.]|uniref:DUF2231 domain-containing protein n=1 Tax=unclassified Pseudonocardia TaxID=2619320 RepID=UPI00086E6F9B|nr:hypothetical protein [Pseudonocardia sp.]ODU26747.1 MAG: hypothetical protein ABS80_06155 [Pseudonocardia sp. SCN 72-51]ODV09176.1 MAG: hypothetical protein ABT15_00780 [Pseudonocardia sp. SCN 73-27]